MSLSPNPIDPFPSAERLLRCRKTKRYFNGAGWTNDPSQAHAFADELDAARACVTHNLHDVELVLRAPVTGTEIFTAPLR